MSDIFDERENAFEAKFAHDQEMQFKAEMRRNRLIAEWAARLLGLTGDEAEAYVQEIVRADLKEAGPEDVIARLAKDLEGRATEAEIRAKLEECLREAKAQLVASGK